MPKFQVVSPHLPSECLRAIDEMLAHDPEFLLEESWIGCSVGDHTAYAVVDAATAEKARDRIPAFLRSRTRAVEVVRPTAEQIAIHNK